MTSNRDFATLLDIYKLLGVEYGCHLNVLKTLVERYIDEEKIRSREQWNAILLAQKICSSERRRKRYDRKYLSTRCEATIADKLLGLQYLEEGQDFMDYYGILETFSEASGEAIRSKFLTLSRRFHPDKHCGAREEDIIILTRRFRDVKEAWDILGDKTNRRLYDGIYRCHNGVNILDESIDVGVYDQEDDNSSKDQRDDNSSKDQRDDDSSKDQVDEYSSKDKHHEERVEGNTDVARVAIAHKQKATKLFVKNFYGTWKELEEAVKVYGVVKKVHLKGKKMGYIIMGSPEEGEKVTGGLNRRKVGKQRVSISYFLTKGQVKENMKQAS